jgi:hypothetical protein
MTTETLKEVDVLKELTRLLNHTLEADGQKLWAKLFQEKTATGVPSTQMGLTFQEAQSALKDLIQDLGRKNLKEKINLALQMGIQSSTLLTSAVIGLILPQNNVILFKKDQKTDAITLQRASLFVSELWLDWMESILNLTHEKTAIVENIPLRIELQKHLKSTQRLVRNSRAGLKRGAILRNKTAEALAKISKKPRKEIRIPLESKAFIALEGFLNQTLKPK